MLGAAVAMAALRRWPGTAVAFAVTGITCFLLGGVNAGFPHSPGVTAFLGLGALGTAASFVLIASESFAEPMNIREGFQLLRQLTIALTAQAILCVTFTAAGYLAVEFGILIYRKLLWA
jgi:hypothetical protein